jgi:hypothetical protein
LAGIAIFRNDRTFDGGVEIGVIEHNEGRIATSSNRAFDGISALFHEDGRPPSIP